MNWRELTDEINRLIKQPERDDEKLRQLLERRRQWARTCGQSEADNAEKLSEPN